MPIFCNLPIDQTIVRPCPTRKKLIPCPPSKPELFETSEPSTPWEGEAPAEPNPPWEGEAPAEPANPWEGEALASRELSPTAARAFLPAFTSRITKRPQTVRLSGSFTLPKGQHPWQVNLRLRTGFRVDPNFPQETQAQETRNRPSGGLHFAEIGGNVRAVPSLR